MSLYNLVRANTATTGTASVVVGAAVSGYLDFTAVPTGGTVSYGLHEGANTEVGRGVWTAATKTLSRDTVLASTNSGNKIVLAGAAEVYVTVLAEDFTPGAIIAPSSPGAYSVSNVTTDRTYDADSTTLDELADILGTLLADLQALGIIG
jgi:hypothetical protein